MPKTVIIFFLGLSFSTHAVGESARFRTMWKHNPSTSMVIGWDQVSGDQPLLYFGTADNGVNYKAYGQSQAPDFIVEDKGMNNHFVELQGLQPNTIYYFVVKDSEGLSKPYSFKTSPADPFVRLSIISGGDSRGSRGARLNANRIVGKLRPTCIVFSGDMTTDDNSDQWIQWMDDWQQTIAKDGRIFPIIVARGNHEATNSVLVNLFDVKSKEVYYNLVLGGRLINIITLNSLIPVEGKQKIWLEKTLKSSKTIWKMAQYHHAIRPHTKNKKEQLKLHVNWATLFFKYQVDVASESDAHVVKWTYPIRPSRQEGSEEGFIRDDERGTVYIGEGGWGAPLRENNDDKKWTRNSGSFNQIKLLFVDPFKIEIRTIQTEFANLTKSVDPKHIFILPEGLRVWSPDNGDVVRIINPNPPHSGDVVEDDLAEAGLPTPKLDTPDQDMGNEAAEKWKPFPKITRDEAGKIAINYKLKYFGNVSVILINRKLKEVTRAQLKNQKPGVYNKTLDLSRVSAGKYLLIIRNNKKIIQRFRVVIE